MTIDNLMIESLFAWGNAWTAGRPVRLEIGSDQYGRVVCQIYRRDPDPAHPLSGLHELARTQIGIL